MVRFLSCVLCASLVWGCSKSSEGETPAATPSPAGAAPVNAAPDPRASGAVKLPEAAGAKPLGKTEGAIYLNVNAKGQVLLPGETIATLDNPAQVQVYLERRAAEDRKVANPNRVEKEDELEALTAEPPLRSTVIFRVDRQTPFEKLHPVFKAARNAGFAKAQWRAIVPGSSDEGQITVVIPPSEHVGPVAVAVPGMEPMRYVVRVTADGAGKIAKITLRKERALGFEADLPEIEVAGKEKPPTKPEPVQPSPGTDLGADVDALLKKLRSLATAKKGLPLPLALEFDGKLLHQDVIRLIDASFRAGWKDAALELLDTKLR
jgi:biopolymer transport protein ExbD